jgi:pimeloyl-ACP methyl ester carboxylesterase
VFRTRFKDEIVAEFLPPMRSRAKQRVIVLCDGMPSIPRKQPLVTFLSQKGYWTIYPRYRGAWESDGAFLDRSPHEDILDIIDELPRGFRDTAFGRKFKFTPDEIFVIGGSFGGAAAILCSLDQHVTRVIANCPVVDWTILRNSEKAETSNKNYAAYLRQAFGHGYRLSDANWKKLYSGSFYNPVKRMEDIDPSKILMFHAKDDPNVPWQSVDNFARSTGVKLKLLRRGGHLKTEFVVRKYWPEIKQFFDLRRKP